MEGGWEGGGTGEGSESQKREGPLRKPPQLLGIWGGVAKAPTKGPAGSQSGQSLPCTPPGNWQKGFHGKNPRLQVRSPPSARTGG